MSLMEVRHFERRSSVKPATFQWTDEAIEKVRVLHAAGERGLAIAREIGAPDPNFVYRKMRKLGLPLKRGQRPRRGRKGKRGFFAFNNPNSQATPPKYLELPVEESPVAVALLDVEANQCRWPISGAGWQTIFCGEAAMLRGCGPYCVRHHRMAYKGRGNA